MPVSLSIKMATGPDPSLSVKLQSEPSVCETDQVAVPLTCTSKPWVGLTIVVEVLITCGAGTTPLPMRVIAVVGSISSRPL